MRRSLLFFFFLLFFGSAQADICIQFAKDLDFDNWDNQGICLYVNKVTDHNCYSREANKKNLDCSIPSSDGWACKKGFVKKGQKCESDIHIPKNAIKTATGWRCSYNFIKNSSGKGCKSLPLNSVKTSENSFKCNFGYKKNSSGSKCIVIPKKQSKTKPDNSYFTNLNVQGWKCRAGFVQVNNNCIQEKYNIPKNAISYNGAWVCGSDYILNKSEDGCQKVPLNGYSSKYSNSWGCKTNYQKSGDKCVIKQTANVIKPANSEIFNGEWKCNSKYRLNKSKDGCEKVPFAAFSPRYSNKWYCISKYIKSGDTCIKKKIKLKVPSNATASVNGNKWLCNYNYRINILKDGCERVPLNAFSPAGSNGWSCISGYYKYGGNCKRNKETSIIYDPPRPDNSDKTILIIAAIVIFLFIANVYKKTSPPPSTNSKESESKKRKETKTEKPKEPNTEKPKEPKTEKPKQPKTEKPVEKTPPDKPKRIVVKNPWDKPQSKTDSKSQQKFYSKNSLSTGDIESQKKKINWKNTLDGISKINNSSVGYLVPTKTGLTKGIFDATKQLREFFLENNIHDYENYPFGEKRKVPVQLVTENGVFPTSVTLYRPKNKKPFPRLWIVTISQHAKPNDLLVFKVIDNVLYVINNAHDGSYDYAHLHLKYLLNFNKSLSKDKFKFDQNKLYSRKDVGLICLPKTGRPKGGMWDTGYVTVKNNLIIFMNIGVPGRTEHDFNNSVNERSKTITWYGKPNSHSFQPTIGKLISGELTPYFFARWDSSNVNFKFLGIGKIKYWRDGTPTLTGSGDKAETIEIKLTYQSVDDKKLIAEPEPLKLIGSENKPKVEPKVKPKVEPKVKPKVEPKVKPKVEPKVAHKTQSTKGPKITASTSERFNLLNFDQYSVEFSKLVSRGVESIDVPAILGLKSSSSYDELVKEKLKNNINNSLKSKELISLEKQAIKSYSKNVDFDLKKHLIHDKENPLLVASIYSSDEKLNNLSSVICNEEAYLLAQIGMQPPEEISAILQHQLMISGKDKIKYLSYWKGQVCIAADIDRNDEFIDTLLESEIDFIKKLY